MTFYLDIEACHSCPHLRGDKLRQESIDQKGGFPLETCGNDMVGAASRSLRKIGSIQWVSVADEIIQEDWTNLLRNPCGLILPDVLRGITRPDGY